MLFQISPPGNHSSKETISLVDIDVLEKTYEDAWNRTDPKTVVCPNCGCTGMRRHGTYTRYASCLAPDKSLKKSPISIHRYRCLSCGVTHAVLPSELIGHLQLPLCSMIYILLMLLKDKAPIEQIAEFFHVEPITIARYKSHYVHTSDWQHLFSSVLAKSDAPCHDDLFSLCRDSINKVYLTFMQVLHHYNGRPLFAGLCPENL